MSYLIALFSPSMCSQFIRQNVFELETDSMEEKLEAKYS